MATITIKLPPLDAHIGAIREAADNLVAAWEAIPLAVRKGYGFTVTLGEPPTDLRVVATHTNPQSGRTIAPDYPDEVTIEGHDEFGAVYRLDPHASHRRRVSALKAKTIEDDEARRG